MCGIGIIFPDSSDKSRTGNKLSAVRRGICPLWLLVMRQQ